MPAAAETKLYRNQILNFRRNHSDNCKRSCIRTLFKRAKTHWGTEVLRKQEETFLQDSWEKRISKEPCKKNKQWIRKRTGTAKQKNHPPYIKSAFGWAARLLQPQRITVAHGPSKLLRRLLSKAKKRLKTRSRRNVAWKANYMDCDKCSIVQIECIRRS